MSQEFINRTSQRALNAPLRVETAGLSLVAFLIIGMYYVANLISLLPSSEVCSPGLRRS